MSTDVLVWSGLGGFRTEVAHASFDRGRLSAHGTQIGVDPEGYRLDYQLETDDRLVTTRLQVEFQACGWSRGIDLRRDPASGWDCQATAVGRPDLPPPGGDMRPLEAALDCDLAFSPLTNLMPVRREGLLQEGSRDFLMAWVAVPALLARLELGDAPSLDSPKRTRTSTRLSRTQALNLVLDRQRPAAARDHPDGVMRGTARSGKPRIPSPSARRP
jgi:hypothetical protein